MSSDKKLPAKNLGQYRYHLIIWNTHLSTICLVPACQINGIFCTSFLLISIYSDAHFIFLTCATVIFTSTQMEKKKNGDTITGTLRNNSFHKYARNEYKGDKTFKIKEP